MTTPRKPATRSKTIVTPRGVFTLAHLRLEAAEISARSQDAYSSDRYRSWAEVAFRLLVAGYTPREAETIMRSKITRWAADSHSARYGHAPAHIVAVYATNFFAKHPADLALWVEETLGPAEPMERITHDED